MSGSSAPRKVPKQKEYGMPNLVEKVNYGSYVTLILIYLSITMLYSSFVIGYSKSSAPGRDENTFRLFLFWVSFIYCWLCALFLAYVISQVIQRKKMNNEEVEKASKAFQTQQQKKSKPSQDIFVMGGDGSGDDSDGAEALSAGTVPLSTDNVPWYIVLGGINAAIGLLASLTTIFVSRIKGKGHDFKESLHIVFSIWISVTVLLMVYYLWRIFMEYNPKGLKHWWDQQKQPVYDHPSVYNYGDDT
jgi:hypothetical protein